MEQRKSLYHPVVAFLTEEIKSSLLENDVEVDDELIVLMMKLATSDDENKFLTKQPLDESEAERLKKIVIERIMSMPPVSRNVILMQNYFKRNHMSRAQSDESYRNHIQENIQSRLDDLRDNIPSKPEHFDNYFNRFVATTILFADMGAIDDTAIINATENALSRVFPKDDITLLASLSSKERSHEIRHLMAVATGIRIFENFKHKNKSNISEIIQAMISDSRDFINKDITVNLDRIVRYTTLARSYFLGQKRENITIEMLNVRQALIMAHQAILYLKILKEDYATEQGISSNLVGDFIECLESLIDTEDKGFSAFPGYIALSRSCRQLQKSFNYVKSLTTLTDTLIKFNEKSLSEIDEKIVAKKAAGKKFPNHQEFFSFPSAKIPEDTFSKANRIDFQEDMNIFDMELSGFCIHTLVKGHGLVALGNPNLGVFEWNDAKYLLSSSKGAIEFRRDPEKFVRKSARIVRKWPELLALFKMDKDDYAGLEGKGEDAQGKDYEYEGDEQIICREVSMQTELHPIPTRIVPDYTWNEWELRRRALILSKVHRCMTHGTQTHWQGLKKNKNCQTFAMVDSQNQTNQNVYADIPTSQFYLYGLRGHHEDVPPHVVELNIENELDMTKCIIANEVMRSEPGPSTEYTSSGLPTFGYTPCPRSASMKALNPRINEEDIIEGVAHDLLHSAKVRNVKNKLCAAAPKPSKVD